MVHYLINNIIPPQTSWNLGNYLESGKKGEREKRKNDGRSKLPFQRAERQRDLVHANLLYLNKL